MLPIIFLRFEGKGNVKHFAIQTQTPRWLSAGPPEQKSTRHEEGERDPGGVVLTAPRDRGSSWRHRPEAPWCCSCSGHCRRKTLVRDENVGKKNEKKADDGIDISFRLFKAWLHASNISQTCKLIGRLPTARLFCPLLKEYVMFCLAAVKIMTWIDQKSSHFKKGQLCHACLVHRIYYSHSGTWNYKESWANFSNPEMNQINDSCYC